MTDNRTTELLPCPWCGGEATVERIGKSGYYYVACNTAYCCDFGKFDTEAEAIEAWNTRADYHGYEQAAIEAWENIKAWNTRAELGSVTCENVSDPPEGFLCSACGWGDFAEPSHLLTTAKYAGRVEGGPNFCPNCGRKVVDEC